MHTNAPLSHTKLHQAVTLDVELSNVGATPVALSSIKVELAVERGAAQPLAQWAPPSSAAAAGAAGTAGPLSPPTAGQPDADAVLLPGTRRVVAACFDVRELGQCSLSCSAVFRPIAGAAPGAPPPGTPPGAAQQQQQQQQHYQQQPQFEVAFFKLLALTPVAVRTKLRAAPSGMQRSPRAGVGGVGGGSGGSSSGGARSFLEVSIENAMRDDSLLLKAVHFVPMAGVAAEDPVAAAAAPFTAAGSGGGGGGSFGGADDWKQRQAAGAAAVDVSPERDARSGGGGGGGAGSSGASGGAPVAAADLAALTPLPPGGNRHFLWLVTRGGGAATAAAAGAAGAAAGGLGRLEIAWKSADGRAGRLQTQPIAAGGSGSGSGGSAAAAAAAAAAAGVAMEAEALPAALPVDAAFDLVLRISRRASAAAAAAAADTTSSDGGGGGSGGEAAGPGPLLLLHGDPASAKRLQRASSSGGAATAAAAAAAATAASAGGAQQPPGDGNGEAEAGVAVIGPRVLRVGSLAPGEARDLRVRLLPLRRGWQRLPAFVLVDAASGAPCASVHDLAVLVA